MLSNQNGMHEFLNPREGIYNHDHKVLMEYKALKDPATSLSTQDNRLYNPVLKKLKIFVKHKTSINNPSISHESIRVMHIMRKVPQDGSSAPNGK